MLWPAPGSTVAMRSILFSLLQKCMQASRHPRRCTRLTWDIAKLIHVSPSVAETWRRVDGKNFRRPRFPFSRPKFLMTSFLVIDQVFRFFLSFPRIFRIFTMLNVVYDPFLTRKTPCLTLFTLSRASIRQHYFSKYWGDGCMGRPPTSNLFGGTVPPVPSRSPPLSGCLL